MVKLIKYFDLLSRLRPNDHVVLTHGQSSGIMALVLVGVFMGVLIGSCFK